MISNKFELKIFSFAPLKSDIIYFGRKKVFCLQFMTFKVLV